MDHVRSLPHIVVRLNDEPLIEEVPKKKKKCRGNRKRQRYTRQLYRQGFDAETVKRKVQERFTSTVRTDESQIVEMEPTTDNIDVYIPLDRITLTQLNINDDADNDSPVGPKRKRFILTPTPTTEARSILDKPCSPSSRLQHESKKPKAVNRPPLTTTTTAATSTSVDVDDHNVVNIDDLQLKRPRYLNVSDRIFKQLFVDVVEKGSNLIQCLNTPEKIQLVRQVTEITNNFHYKDLQGKLWNAYASVSSSDQDWDWKITNRFANDHHISRMYRPKKLLIQQRLRSIDQQKQRLVSYLQDNLTKLSQQLATWQPSISQSALTDAIDTCVRQHLRRLKDEFEYKIHMITLNWTDQQLLRQFYALNPNQDVIHLAMQIWQTTAAELRTKEKHEICRKCIHLGRFPNKIQQLLRSLLLENRRGVEKFLCDDDQRASCDSRSSKLINHCQFQLMCIYLDEFNMSLHRYAATYTNLKDELVRKQRENPLIYTNALANLIEQRRQAMIERLNRTRQYTLQTFFDEAPAVDIN